MSFIPQVIADDTNEYVGNALRFATEDEARCYVIDLAMRWTSVRKWRVAGSNDPVNYSWNEGRLHRLEEKAS